MKTKRMNNKTNKCHHVGKGKSDISRQFDELKPFLRFLRMLHMNVETKKRIIPVMIAYFRPRFTSKFTREAFSRNTILTLSHSNTHQRGKMFIQL